MNQPTTPPSYTVQRDDTLTKIAKRFGTTVKTLKDLNNISNVNTIFPGQLIILPQSTTPAHPDLQKPTTSAGAKGPIKSQLPSSGNGFVIYNPDHPPGSDRFATTGFIAALTALAGEWAEAEDVPIAFGDMSRKDGVVFPPHKGHRSGREVDIRPFRRDGANQPVVWTSAAYDRARTRRLMELIKRREKNAQIFFNDVVLIDAGLAKPLKGHDNHLHLQIYD